MFIIRKCPDNENENAGKMTILNGIPNRRGRPSAKTVVHNNNEAKH